MTSKNLFFNLMKENAKRRLWTVALQFLVFFFLFPVSTAMMISSYLSPDRLDVSLGVTEQMMLKVKAELLERYLNWVSVDNSLVILILIASAVLCGASGFAYLHSRKKTDFYHSIPVKRETLFFTVYLNGILFTAVPYLIGVVISTILVQVKAAPALPWGSVISAYVMHMAFYLMIYSTVILAFMLTGNLIVGLLGTSVFFFWGPSVLFLKGGYFSSYFATYYGTLSETQLFRSSPVFWYFSAMAKDTGLGAGKKALCALAVAVGLTILSLVLYKLRPSEAAGRAMAFSKSRFPIKFLVVVPSALLCSLIFYEIKRSDSWSIFGLLCGLLISYAVIEIIYNFDFRKLFAHRIQLASCAVCAAAVLAFFRFDLMGFDSYIPSEAKIESAGVVSYILDDNAAYNFLSEVELGSERSEDRHYIRWSAPSSGEITMAMELTDISEVLELSRRGVEDTARVKADRLKGYYYSNFNGYSQVEGEENDVMGTVLVQYHLKNGKNPIRSYYLNLTAVREALDTIYDSAEYKNTLYPILNRRAEEIAGINYQEQRSYNHVNLPDATMKEKLLTAYQQELSALTAEVRRQESPVAAIQFKTNEIQEMIDIIRSEKGDYSQFNQRDYYPIYPSFTKTIGLLKQCGIEVGSILTADNVEEIELIDYFRKAQAEEESYEEDGDAQAEYVEAEPALKERYTLKITDRAQIEEILNASVTRELGYNNSLNTVISDIGVTVRLKKAPEAGVDEEYANQEDFTRESTYDDSTTYSVSLDSDKVPKFIKEAFKFDENREKSYRPYGY